jgi:hypothetical protein
MFAKFTAGHGFYAIAEGVARDAVLKTSKPP